MTVGSGYRIDWQTQFQTLEPFINGKPGVVHAKVAAGSPTDAFVRVLRGYLEDNLFDKPWICVQIDPEDSSTHYFEDVVRQISHVADAPLDLQSLPGQTVTIGANLEAGGNVAIRDVRVNGRTTYSLDSLAEALEVALRERLRTHRVALLFVRSHKYKRTQLDAFGSRLWRGKLECLIGEGLLVIDLADPNKRKADCSWPPPADAQFDLPSHYGSSEKAHAALDVRTIALEAGVHGTVESADVFASTLLSSSHDIRDLHVRVARAVTGL